LTRRQLRTIPLPVHLLQAELGDHAHIFNCQGERTQVLVARWLRVEAQDDWFAISGDKRNADSALGGAR
jgi:hypothetical protein